VDGTYEGSFRSAEKMKKLPSRGESFELWDVIEFMIDDL
jgi:hypothetical protein